MLVAMVLSMALGGPVVYVSPKGNDSLSGQNPKSAVATLARALEITRNRPNATIRIESGIYTIDSPITLEKDHQGLTIEGVGKTVPILSGARAAVRWHKVTETEGANRLSESARPNFYVCDLPGVNMGQFDRRGFGLSRKAAGIELFFDDQPMTVCRYPNNGWLRIGKVLSPKSFTYSDSVPGGWGPNPDLWVLGFWTFDWAESYEKVVALDSTTVQTNEQGGSYGYAVGRRFRFQNALEALDEPGEYQVDREHQRIYFWPPKPLSGHTATVSVLDATALRLDHANGVTIRNVCLEGGRDGGILASQCDKLTVKGCVVRNFGTYGISLLGCSNSGVVGCDVTGVGESGITLSGGDRKTLTPGNLVAEDNHIWNYSRWTKTYQPGIVIDGVGNKIINNRISDAPHEAIALSGNDHLIERNDISRVCTETGDAGAIYMGRNPTMRGNVIRWNRFTNVGPKISTEGNYTGVMSVYLDDCWCGTTVEGNVFDTNGTGIMIGGGRDNKVIANVFLGCQPGISYDARGKGWAKNMFATTTEWGFHDRYNEVNADKPPYTTKYPRLSSYWTDDPAFPKGTVITRNIALGGKWMTMLDGLTDRDYAGGGNVLQEKAGTLAEALKLAPPGFVSIPLDEIGRLSKNRPIDRVSP